MSPEIREILHEWIERSIYEVSAAHGQTASWYGFTHRDRDATNGDYILGLIGKIEVVVEECGCGLDQVQELDPVRVPDATAEYGKRDLTYRETLMTVKAQVLEGMAEAKALADLRAAKAKLAALRAKKKASVHTTNEDVRTTASVDAKGAGVRTSRNAP